MKAVIWAWRHPRPQGAEGRCIGRTDLPVDRRKVRRLAHRIRQAARRHGLPRVVHTSPLQRCAAVGRQLRRWGWRHRIEPALLEMDFGNWEGQPWPAIERAEIDAWCAGFGAHAPGGGESLDTLLQRVAAWHAARPVVMVAHGGWMLARRWLDELHPQPPSAATWPAAPAYATLWHLATQADGDATTQRVVPSHDRAAQHGARPGDIP